MKAFLDTSVLIAASDVADPHHTPSFSLLSIAQRETTACGVHTLAETYAVLSRLPGGKKKRPEYASFLIEQILARVTVYSLSPEEYANAIRDAASKSLAGGMIFDALLLACARKSHAERIYTWNEKHFRMVAPDLADRITNP